jgi:hypothetical protein
MEFPLEIDVLNGLACCLVPFKLEAGRSVFLACEVTGVE